jgi:hypothetical protein
MTQTSYTDAINASAAHAVTRKCAFCGESMNDEVHGLVWWGHEFAVPTAAITAAVLRGSDLNTLVVATPSGRKLGAGYGPSLAFGLGSHEGDFEGFAAWLASQA